jgi:hypothetical protein
MAIEASNKTPVAALLVFMPSPTCWAAHRRRPTVRALQLRSNSTAPTTAVHGGRASGQALSRHRDPRHGARHGL